MVDFGDRILIVSAACNGHAGLSLAEINDLGESFVSSSKVDQRVLDLAGAGCGDLIGGDDQLGIGLIESKAVIHGGGGGVIVDPARCSAVSHSSGCGYGEDILAVYDLAVATAYLILQSEDIGRIGLITLYGADPAAVDRRGNIESGVYSEFVAYIEFLNLCRAVKAVDCDGRRLCCACRNYADSKHSRYQRNDHHDA